MQAAPSPTQSSPSLQPSQPKPGEFKKTELSDAKRRLLAERMAGMRRTPDDVILARVPGEPTPISVEQHRVWLHTAIEPELPIYNEAITIHRVGSFDLALLERSFNDVLQRHEAWRTGFAMVGGALRQEIYPSLQVSLRLVDLTSLPVEEREMEACRLATEDSVCSFDLKTPPLFRACVFRLSETHHWLQMTLHHIIFDGVSLHRTFLPELAATYAAFEAGREAPCATPKLQYGDYAVWRESQLARPQIEQHLNYWRTQLAGELPVLRLPIDRPRPALLGHRGAVETLTLPPDLTASLRTLSRAHGATLYMTLLAGLKTLFFRYSGQEDIIVGGLADGRRRPEFENMIGYFLDTFAVRTRPNAALPFSSYLAEVRHTVLGALAAADVPFNRVVQALQSYRDHSHHPVFQTFLSVQPHAETPIEGWRISKTNVAIAAAKFDLYIEVEERSEDIGIRMMYNTDLFDVATIERMAGHWTTLLTAVAANPECALGALPLLTAGEQHQLLVEWNQQERPITEATLHAVIERQALRTPNAPAVSFEGKIWSYAELNRQADHLAGQLRRAGAGPGSLVAVCLDRSLYLPAALFAILKTGAAYLPLDPGTPRARRQLCLEDAQPAVILSQRALIADLPPSDGTVLLLEDALAAPAEPAADPAAAPLSLDAAAYVIHTSGSTGRPKGVEISHRAIVNLLESMQDKPGFTATDSMLALTTVSFDIAGLELFLPLICGGHVVIVSRTVALDPYLLSDVIDRSGCTVLQATPATWRGLLAAGWSGKPGMRVLCGGEAMTRDLANSMLALELEVWNVYGPTETTVWSTVHRVYPGIGPVPVGRPIANTHTYILDAQQQPVPIGVPGELYIGGTGLANGYRGQPKLTADKFVERAGIVQERLYRTGDNALYRADGTIEIQGRADNQVKIRGYRIELEDVEASFMAYPHIALVAAKVWPDATGGCRLSAYFVAKQNTSVDIKELRDFLRLRIPEYMIPSDIVVLDTMPLTSNGKVDRKALQPPTQVQERTVSLAPATEQEQQLATIWMELLGVPSVSLDDNFFDLGGHSLLVARLQQRILSTFQQKIAMAAIFHAPTIAGQVALLTTKDDDVDRARALTLQPRGTKPMLFWLQPPPLIQNLIRGLGDDQPIAGVTIALDDIRELGSTPTIEAMAAYCVRTITKVQPQGPYFLGGLCTHGILAYEVAVQLTRAGHIVSSTVMLDAENPVFYRRFDRIGLEIEKIAFYGRRVFRRSGSQMFLRHVRSRLMRLVKLEKAANTEMSAIEAAVLAGAFLYKPPVYMGDVLLLLPSDRPSGVDYVTGWKTVVNTLSWVDVRGHHDELLTAENAHTIAQAITQHFEQISKPEPHCAPTLDLQEISCAKV